MAGDSCSKSSTSGPVECGSRIGTLDTLRGVAILGILLMNIPHMGMLGHWLKPPLPAVMNIDWMAWLVQDTVFNGTTRGLFTILFGAGMLLMLGEKGDDSQRVQAFYIRCFALIVLGIANFTIFLWPGEILFTYGVVGLVLFFFRKANQRLLWTASIALLFVMTAGLVTPRLAQLDLVREGPAAVAAKAAGETLTERQTEAVAVYEKAKSSIHPKPEDLERERLQRTNWPGVLSWSGAEWKWFNLDPVSFWYLLETLALMLMGMALYRSGVLTGEKSVGFYLALAVGGYVVGIAVRGGYNYLAWKAGFEIDPDAAIARGILFEAGRVTLTLGLMGLILAVCKAGLFKGWQRVMQAVGRLSLTNYVGQSIITSVIFYGLGMLGYFSFAQLMGLCVVVWIAQMIFSVVWLKVFTMGPLEWGLRALTYGRAPALLRRSGPQPLPSGQTSVAG